MPVWKRVALCRLIEKMNQQQTFSQRLTLEASLSLREQGKKNDNQ